MCGRYTETAAGKVLREYFGPLFDFDELDEKGFAPRFNLAPGQDAPVILNDGRRALNLLRWGLVPFWAKDEKAGFKMINARAETLTEKPAYRKAFERRRCLVLADGFYEWRKAGTVKVPYRFVMNEGEPFAFAGLWERWRKPDGGELQSFTIITTGPNALCATVHDRMPAILPRPAYEQWLDPAARDTGALAKQLAPFPEAEMRAYPVSQFVNNARNDSPQCVEPV